MKLTHIWILFVLLAVLVTLGITAYQKRQPGAVFKADCAKAELLDYERDACNAFK